MREARARIQPEALTLGAAEKFLTPQELVARYKNAITARTLANWRSTGQGPAYVKVGGRVLYALSAVLQWEAIRTMIDVAQLCVMIGYQ